MAKEAGKCRKRWKNISGRCTRKTPLIKVVNHIYFFLFFDEVKHNTAEGIL